MTRFKQRLCAILSTLLFVFSIGAQAQTRPDADDFVVQMRDVEISPDGQFLSMIQPIDGEDAVVIYPLGGGAPSTVTAGQRNAGEHIEIVWHAWAGPDRVVINVQWSGHRGRYEVRESRLLAVDPDGGNVKVLSITDQASISAISEGNMLSRLPAEPDHVLVARYMQSGTAYVLNANRVDVNTGRSLTAASGLYTTIDYFTNADGDVIGRVDFNDGVYTILVRDRGSHNWREIHSYRWFASGQRAFYPIIALDDGRKLYLYSNHEGRDGLYSFDLENGGEFVREFLHDKVDISYFNYSTLEDRAISINYVVDLPEAHFLDEAEERLHDQINRALPGAVEIEVSATDDRSIRIFASYGPGDPPLFYMVNMEEGSIDEIGQMYPQLHPDSMSPVEAISYKARDGTNIPAYLALPPGADISDGPFPFVLYPHGGPQARDTLEFDPIRQFIATRGYAVLAPNFRGSTGYGNNWTAQGYEEWGGLMQTDLLDGVQYLIDEGIADPENMCFVGWSYSAYAALFAAVDTPEMFNCYIGVNGVYDLPDLRSHLISIGADWSVDYWSNTMGRDEDALARVSPSRRVDAITRPVLIIVSDEDRTAPPRESHNLIRDLGRAGVQFDSRVYERGDHSMSYNPSWVGTLESIGEFLDQNME